LHVTDQQGNRIDTGETVVSANRRQMTVNLRPDLPAGRYIVTWRTFDDADGEIFGDCYTFFVGQAAADAAITDNFRLDAGSSCERIEVSARDGTPIPGQTPPASGEQSGGDEHTEAGDDSGNGVPAWVLMLGVAGGVAVGLVGGRFIGGRA
jgi:hypothetical protein